MEICIRVKKKTTCDMAKANIFTMMAVTTMGIGSKEKWMVMGNFTIVTEIWSIKEIGKMIGTKEGEYCTV